MDVSTAYLFVINNIYLLDWIYYVDHKKSCAGKLPSNKTDANIQCNTIELLDPSLSAKPIIEDSQFYTFLNIAERVCCLVSLNPELRVRLAQKFDNFLITLERLYTSTFEKHSSDSSKGNVYINSLNKLTN